MSHKYATYMMNEDKQVPDVTTSDTFDLLKARKLFALQDNFP